MGCTQQASPASQQSTSSFNFHILDNATSPGSRFPGQRPRSSPNRLELLLGSAGALWGSLARSTVPERGGDRPGLLGVLSPCQPSNHRLYEMRAVNRKANHKQSHLLLPPPGSSCRESSRPVPRRRRRGCCGSGSAAWSAPQHRRPPSPAGPSWM